MSELTSFEYKKFREDIIHDFDLSVVLPFHENYEIFTKVLSNNAKFLQRNGIEVVVSLFDSIYENQLISFLKSYPFINWKLVVTPSVSPITNPVKIINIGVENSSKKYILVCDPQIIFSNDIVYLLRYTLRYYPNHYALGTKAFIKKTMSAGLDYLYTYNSCFYKNEGTLMTERRFIERIGGYDESLTKLSAQEENITKRLDMIGISQLIIPSAKGFYMEGINDLDHRPVSTKRNSPEQFRMIFYPQTPFSPNGNKINDSVKVSYDYLNNKYNKELCETYLKSFLQYSYKEEAIFSKKYKIILLAQFYNEKKHLSQFLNNMEKFFEGIILLDDGSDDRGYDHIKHEKVLIKVRKERFDFDDLGNRNILMRLSSFINVDWLCFMDIDERIDERFANFKPILSDSEIDAVSFKFIHLWDSEDTYNKEIGIDGVFERCRLFRNLKNSLIHTTQKKLHFSLNPNKKEVFRSNILVKHYGNLTPNDRNKKYEFYQKEDLNGDQQSYEHLLKKPRLGSINEIALSI